MIYKTIFVFSNLLVSSRDVHCVMFSTRRNNRNVKRYKNGRIYIYFFFFRFSPRFPFRFRFRTTGVMFTCCCCCRRRVIIVVREKCSVVLRFVRQTRVLFHGGRGIFVNVKNKKNKKYHYRGARVDVHCAEIRAFIRFGGVVTHTRCVNICSADMNSKRYEISESTSEEKNLSLSTRAVEFGR